MVSPNMTYPQAIANAAQKTIIALENKQAGGVMLSAKEEQDLTRAKDEFAKNNGGTSMLGLTAPLFPLKNPGIVSIPLGFLAAVLGALAFREKRAEEMFDEIYVRQNTGIGMAKAIDH
jgi:cation/acetate symporter